MEDSTCSNVETFLKQAIDATGAKSGEIMRNATERGSLDPAFRKELMELESNVLAYDLMFLLKEHLPKPLSFQANRNLTLLITDILRVCWILREKFTISDRQYEFVWYSKGENRDFVETDMERLLGNDGSNKAFTVRPGLRTTSQGRHYPMRRGLGQAKVRTVIA